MLLSDKRVPVITIDGPGGSGKGAVSEQLAHELGWHLLDSGVIYRALAFIARATASAFEEDQLLPLVDQLTQGVLINPADDKLSILWEQRDIMDTIRTEEYGRLASQLAVYPRLRNALLTCQRAFRKFPGLVADGRDMGTVVFPDAFLKIFLYAALEERAKRRYLQLKANGKHVSLRSVRSELEQRDTQDRERAVAPLQAAEGAFVIDTTHLSIQAVLQRVRDKLRDKR